MEGYSEFQNPITLYLPNQNHPPIADILHWDIPKIDKGSLYNKNAIVHKLRTDDDLFSILPVYYSEYFDTKNIVFLPTIGVSNDEGNLLRFKHDLVDTILTMNNLLHPRMIKGMSEILLPNFKSESYSVIVNGNQMDSKRIGEITIRYQNRPGYDYPMYEGDIVADSGKAKYNIKARSESDWKNLMKKGMLDTSKLFITEIVGFLILACKEKTSTSDYTITNKRRPNLLEIRNFFHALFYLEVNLPGDVARLLGNITDPTDMTERIKPDLLLGEFIEKYLPIILKNDTFAYYNKFRYQTVFNLANTKALANQSTNYINSKILNGALVSFMQGIIITIGYDEYYFKTDRNKEMLDIKRSIQSRCDNLIELSMLIFIQVNKIKKESIEFKKDILKTLLEIAIAFIPFGKFFKPAVSSIAGKKLLDYLKEKMVTIIVSSGTTDYDEIFTKTRIELNNLFKIWVEQKKLNESTKTRISATIGTGFDLYK